MPMPQAMKIPEAKAALNKEWEELEKIPAWNLEKMKSKKDVFSGSTKRERESPLCCIDGHLSSQKCGVRTKISEKKERSSRTSRWYCKRRLWSRCTEQGSSVSQMTAAKVMDVIARLPGCAGQPANAVSAYTQVKVEEAPKLLRIPKSECPDIWIRLPRHKWPKSWSYTGRPSGPSGTTSVRTPTCWPLVGKTVRGSLNGTSIGKVPNWECLLVHRKTRTILICIRWWH